MRRLLPIVFAFGVVIALLNVLGVVGFRYPRVVENDPLLSPVLVAGVTGDRLMLDDGRVFKVIPAENLADAIRESGNRVDVEQTGGETLIYVKRRGWLCGTPWAALVRIPLFADDVNINRRELLNARVETAAAGS